MRHFPILIITLLITCTYASPALPVLNNIPSTNTSLLYPNLYGAYQCFELKFFKSRRASLGDCARAVAFLPNFHEAGVFHRAGNPDEDPFTLPRTEKYKSCQVKVDLRFGRSDSSTWAAINIATGKIMAACTIGHGQPATTGGEINAGSENRIIITVGKTESTESVGGGSGNHTDVAIGRRSV